MPKNILPGDQLPGGYRAGQIQKYTPEQIKLHQQQFAHVAPDSYLGKLAAGDESAFAEMEAPALKQFGGLQAGLASKFSGMGLGARGSSGHMNMQNQAASDFAQQLQSQRINLRRQAIMDLMGLSNQILGQQPYDRFAGKKRQKEGGGWGGAAGALVGGVGGFMMGGPAGAFYGANLGYGVGSQF